MGKQDLRQKKWGGEMQDKKNGETRCEAEKNGETRRETKKDKEMRQRTKKMGR